MPVLDRLLFRTIIPLSSRTNDTRPHISSRIIRFSYNDTEIEPLSNEILIDTGASKCTTDPITMSRLTGKNVEDLEDYLEYLSDKPRDYSSLIRYGPPFKDPFYMVSFGGSGHWSIHIKRVTILMLSGLSLEVDLFTTRHSKTILGMTFLEKVKLILNRNKERVIVL